MATRYPSDYDNHRRVEQGVSRSGRTGSSARSAAPRSGDRRPASGTRSASGARAASGQRSASGGRPAQRPGSTQRQGSAKRPQQRKGNPPRKGGRRRRATKRFPVFVALTAALVLALVLVVVKPFGRPKGDPVIDAPVVPASNPVENIPALTDSEVDAQPEAQYDNLADQLADSDYDVGSLSASEMAQVTDLSVNTGLPDEWMNVLLLGTDERHLNDSARTDAMMICSINRKTGEVKLSSIMRDLAVEFTDIGKYNGTYRINAANFFGGSNLAMRTVNECFNMNIQYYVMVNFYGFQRIAERLGGIDIDITEDEMNQINHWVYRVYRAANKENIDISDLEWAKLETYGENVHLNGTQTLAYARIRKLNGGDYMRSQRQRLVLEKLLEKVKKLDAIQMASLATEMLSEVKTNLPFDDIFSVAMLVCGNGLNGVESLRLPISGTYKEERRNEQDMLYDCDFAANALELYNFIYD